MDRNTRNNVDVVPANEDACSLLLIRPKYYRNGFRRYRIFLNDNELGGIENGDRKTLKLPVGDYRLFLRIDWMKSNIVNFRLSPQDNHKEVLIDFPYVSTLRTTLNFLLLSFLVGVGMTLGGAIGGGIGAGIATGLTYSSVGTPALNRIGLSIVALQ